MMRGTPDLEAAGLVEDSGERLEQRGLAAGGRPQEQRCPPGAQHAVHLVEDDQLALVGAQDVRLLEHILQGKQHTMSTLWQQAGRGHGT